MVIVFTLVVAAAFAATWRAPKWYRSEMQLRTAPSRIVTPVDQNGDMRDQVVLYISTLRAVASSDHVLGSTLLRLQNAEKPDAPGIVLPPDLGEDGLPSDPEKMKQWVANVQAWNQAVSKFVGEHTEDVDKLKERLTIVTPGGPDATFTQTLKMQVTWPEERKKAAELGKDPKEYATERALAVIQELMRAYRLRETELEWKRATAATKFLSDKSLAAAKKALDDAETAYTAYINENVEADLVDMQQLIGQSSGSGGKISLATEYAKQMTSVEEIRVGLESIKGALEEQLKPENAEKIAVPDSLMASNPSVRALETKILDLKLHINSLEPRYTDDYKELSTARSELAAAKAELRLELAKQLTRTQQKIDVLVAQQKSVSASYKKERDRLDEIASKIAPWQSLRDEKAEARNRYNKEKDLVVSAVTAQELSNVSIMLSVLADPAKADPDKPVKPVMLINMILAVIVGFFLSLIYAFGADHFDHSLKGIDEAERYLGLPVLASVPKLGRRMIRAKRGVK